MVSVHTWATLHPLDKLNGPHLFLESHYIGQSTPIPQIYTSWANRPVFDNLRAWRQFYDFDFMKYGLIA